MTTFAQDFKELMDGFNKIEAAAKKQFPLASTEEIYAITSSALNRSLNLKVAS